MSEVERWRELPDGAIEFTMCRLRTADRWQPATSWKSFRNGLSKSARRGSCFASPPLRTTTSAAPAARSPSSPRIRRTRPDGSRASTTHSDAIGGIPLFAACDTLETSATHVFGDVVFRSEPVVVDGGKRAAKRR
jgi:hypothetical protein